MTPFSPERRDRRPYGSWPSPYTAARVAAGSLRLDQIVIDGDDVYWLEGRAGEGGRSVVVRRTPDGRVTDMTPPGWSVRSRVYEYGGAAYAVADGTLYFVQASDQCLYRQPLATPGVSLTPEALTRPGDRWVDLRVDGRRGRLIAVREDVTDEAREPISTIAAIPLGPSGRAPTRGDVLVAGADFHAVPRLSPDGQWLAWLEWRHPNLPWDGTELHVARVDADGRPGRSQCIAGGDRESIFQPEWSPAGVLAFASDRTGWWNLYTAEPARDWAISPLHPVEAECGKPQWTTAMRTYAWLSASRMAVSYCRGGRWHLAQLDLVAGQWSPVDADHDPEESIAAEPSGGAVWYVGGAPTRARAIVRTDLATGHADAVWPTRDNAPEPAAVAVAQALVVDSGGRPVYAFHYPPTHSTVQGPEGERPPLLVLTHGGPTAATSATLDLEIQFWTSRGIAVVDVNYSGSTGYGRSYRERLVGAWGIADVEDVVAVARHLVREGLADPARLAIRGGSAGGYTTLAALTFTDVFAAGASYYGISDLAVLATETHKFESRYMDALVGPYPEAADRYRARSPIHHVDRLDCALVLFQGLDDRVVPPNQSVRMAEAVTAKGRPVAYVAFEGEQHGFRKAATKQRALEAELEFYGRVMGFTPADDLPALEIANLPESRQP